MKPICVPCQRFFRPKKNGFYFIEGHPIAANAAPGKRDAPLWAPYKLWSGDVWACEGCGAEIIVGTGRSPIAEHYESDFEKKLASYGANYQVNDC